MGLVFTYFFTNSGYIISKGDTVINYLNMNSLEIHLGTEKS